MEKRFLVSAIAATAMTVGFSSSAFAAETVKAVPGQPNCHGHFIAQSTSTTHVTIHDVAMNPAYDKFTGGTVQGAQEFIRDFCGR